MKSDPVPGSENSQRDQNHTKSNRVTRDTNFEFFSNEFFRCFSGKQQKLLTANCELKHRSGLRAGVGSSTLDSDPGRVLISISKRIFN